MSLAYRPQWIMNHVEWYLDHGSLLSDTVTFDWRQNRKCLQTETTISITHHVNGVREGVRIETFVFQITNPKWRISRCTLVFGIEILIAVIVNDGGEFYIEHAGAVQLLVMTDRVQWWKWLKPQRWLCLKFWMTLTICSHLCITITPFLLL